MYEISEKKTVMIIAGEASGDVYGAKLVKSMAKKIPIDFYGIGSYAMKNAGVKILIDAKKIATMGITEVIAKMPFIISCIRKIKSAIKEIKPDLMVLIDFPDFNLRIAPIAKKLNIPVLYYVGPQIWAWRKNRIKKIKQLVTHVALILPFEEIFYRKKNIPATFVGHPLMDNFHLSSKTPKNNINCKSITIGLLPGSRNKEISRLLPIMLKSAKLIKQFIPSAKFIVSKVNFADTEKFDKIIKTHAGSFKIVISQQPAKEIFDKCTFLIAASGTVTLEAALYGIPTLIIYKVSPLSYIIGKALINVEHIGLANLILNKRIFPELIQEQASYENVAKLTIEILKNKKKINSIKKDLLLVKTRLGRAGSSKRVAKIAINMLL